MAKAGDVWRLSVRFPSKIDCLRFLLKNGFAARTVIDVGTQVGTHELMALFPQSHHLLIEPEAAHAEQIAQNYAKIPHTYVEAAASDHEGEATLTSEHRGGVLDVTHSRFLDGKGDETARVRVATLDLLVLESGLDGPFLLKIDTDGHEDEVIAGASETLKQCGVVVVEAPLYTLSKRAAALEAAGLRLFDIVDLAYYHDTLSQVDLVFVNPAFFDPPALNPWQAKTFEWTAWRQHKPVSDRLNPVRRVADTIKRIGAGLTRPFR